MLVQKVHVRLMMNIQALIKGSLRTCCVVLFCTANLAIAEDIDLFTGANPGGGNPPTILLTWHSSANSNADVTHTCTYNDTSEDPSLGQTVAGMEQCALVNALLKIRDDANVSSALLGNVRVGLMVFNKQGFDGYTNQQGETIDNGDDDCGFLIFPPELMEADTADADGSITRFIEEIKAFAKNASNPDVDTGILANQSRLGDTMAEAWAAMNGLSTSCSGVDYSSVVTTASDCRGAVIVYIGNATKETASVSDGNAKPDELLATELTSGFGYSSGSQEYEFFTEPMAVTSLNNSSSENNVFWGDEWAQFMHRVNPNDRQDDVDIKNLSTYAIAVYDPDLEDKLEGEINFYANMADKGGGKSFLIESNDDESLTNVLIQIFNEVQAVNSVFASATLPVSANTQGTFLNQIFIAMFRPDANAFPRWYGNLKHYQLGFDAGGNIVLTDAKPENDPTAGPVQSVTNPITGTVAPSAVSFWTTNDPDPAVTGWPSDGYWRNSPSGDGFGKDSPDGDLVQKGGAAQMLRVENLTATYSGAGTKNSRNLLTCKTGTPISAGCSSGLTDFSNEKAATFDSSAFGVSASSIIDLTLAAGKGSVTGFISSCSAGKVKTCTVTYSGTPSENIQIGDEIATPNTLVGCDFSTPCSITAVDGDASTFSFVFSGKTPDDGCAADDYCSTYYIASKTVEATSASHGFGGGESALLSDCTGYADSSATPIFGLDDTGGLPGLSATRGVTISNSGLDSDTFRFSLSTAGYIQSGASVTCKITTSVDLESLISWVRGEDNAGNEVDAGPCDGVTCTAGEEVTIRPSVHGDVLHSRPAVINYGDADEGVIVFYGANDGVFHAINGNQEKTVGGVRPGGELWGFIAPEFFDKFKRQYQNTPAVKLSGGLDATAKHRDYFFDGSPTVLQDDRAVSTTPDKRYIFLTARRGGRLIYALDVTDPTNPTYLWSRDNSEITELGYTWSQAKVGFLKGYQGSVTVESETVSVPKPVLIMGAGYDPVEDIDPVPSTRPATVDGESLESAMGRGIVILDAATGDVVWAVLADCTGSDLNADNCTQNTDLTHSIAADITFVDTDFDGLVDRLYTADTGGNIWRVNINQSDVTQSTMYKLAELGGTGSDARKFLFPPDVIITKDFAAVVAVSGDREHPLFDDRTDSDVAYNVNNRFYLIQDTGDATNTVRDVDGERELFQQCDDGSFAEPPTGCDSSGQDITFDTLHSGKFGYYIDLPGPGEKGVNAPIVVAGKVFFGTNQPDIPSEGSCSANLGVAKAYQIDFRTGETESRIFSGGGLPPSPIAGLVSIGDETVPFIVGGQGPSPFDPGEPEIEVSDERNRAYWYFE